MGYDCTLHAVDEKEISGDFVQAVLDGKPPKAGLAGEDPGLELWNETLKSLVEKPADESVAQLCLLALIHASRSQPYHYERGFSLCRWPFLPDGLDARFPAELTDSPEILFGRLLDKYPRLRGRFPEEFSGNWSTGILISKKKIPKALRWVQEKVGEFAEGDRKLFRGLILVLKYCVRHKLAYWEGTDLPIPMAEISPEGAEQRRASRAFKWPDGGYVPIACQGSLFVCEERLGPSQESRTALADFSVWPPAIQWLPEFATKADFSPAGKLVTIAAEPGKYYYTVRLRSVAKPEAQIQELEVADPNTVGENGYDWCGFVGEQVVSMLKFIKGKKTERYPLFQQGALLLDDRSFRAAMDRHEKPSGRTSLFRPDYISDYELIRVGVAQTGDGVQVFIWGEHGHELVENGYRKTFDIGPHLRGGGIWTSVPAGADGFFFINSSDKPLETDHPSLYEIRRGGVPVPHLPKLTNIMEVRPGPDGSLLLFEGHNKVGDWGKLYWPRTKQIARLKPNLLPDIAPDHLLTFYWLEEKRTLLAFTSDEVWPVPWSELEKLPRRDVR